MSKSKLGISSFDLNMRFENKEQSYKYAKRLKEFIRYTCKKKADKGWSAEAMICVSSNKGNSTIVYYEHNGKVGRPKKVISKYYSEKGNIKVDWHLHILLISKPMYAFRETIKKYIDKNWVDVKIGKESFDYGKTKDKSKIYKKDTNINKAEYFIDQADEILFCNYNYTGEERIPKGYSLKDLYKAYMKARTALRYNRTIGNDKRLKLEDKYNKIKNFYWDLSKEQDKKVMDMFMKQVQLDKIASNYEIINNNKVQENESLKRRKNEEEIWL
mgnify:FL=1